MAELFELTETAQILQQMAEEVKRVYKEKLQESDRVASGDLMRSVETEVRINNTTYSVVMDLRDYWEYVENDTKPHWPPQSAIDKWIFVKPVVPRPHNNRVPSPESLSFLIRRRIAGKAPDGNGGFKPGGTKGTHDLEHTKEEVIPHYLERLKEALGHDAINYIRKVMAEK